MNKYSLRETRQQKQPQQHFYPKKQNFYSILNKQATNGTTQIRFKQHITVVSTCQDPDAQ